jgi:glutathione S-transferase
VTPVLITIPISHYCEKARWALDRAGVAYRESRHAPFFHAAYTLPSGKGRTTPQLRLADRTLGESRDIVAYAEEQSPGALYPSDQTQREEVVALEAEFDREIGPHLRRWAYGDVLHRPELVLRFLTFGVPGYERSVTRALFPLVRAGMRRAMAIDDAGVARSRERMNSVVTSISARFDDGRRFLVGERFTAADLTLAALLAPLFAPVGYGEMRFEGTLFDGARFVEDAARWCESAAVRHAMRMYESERHAKRADVP